MAKESSFQELVNMCNQVGWEKGIASLEAIVTANENAQSYLFAGDAGQVKQATRLSQTIIKQNLTIAKLKEYKKQNSL